MDERGGRRHFRTGLALTVPLAGALTACAAGSPEAGAERGFPSLRTVPAEPRPSASVEERRRIVQELIEERDDSLRHAGAVRGRSGLGGLPEAASADPGWDAEAIVQDGRAAGASAFRPNDTESPEGREAARGPVYRDDTRFEDGGLDDFIRTLERDTSPRAPETPVEGTVAPRVDESGDAEGGEASGEDEVGALREPWPAAGPWSPADDAASMVLAAFAPVIGGRPHLSHDAMIRLVADEEGEPGFFCNWLGWTVAWSSICVAGEEGDAEANADGDENGSDSASDGAADGDQTERAGRPLTEQEVEDAIGEGEESVMAPVGRSLEKLRDFVRSRRGEGTAPSSEGIPPFRADEVADPTPVPERRPERPEDLTVVDRGETFHFDRTPSPAFKPSRDRLDGILPPEGRIEGSAGIDAAVSPARSGTSSASREAAPVPAPRKPSPSEPVSSISGTVESGSDAATSERPSERASTDTAATGSAPEPVSTPKAPFEPERNLALSTPSADKAAPERARTPETPSAGESGASFDDPGVAVDPYIITFSPGDDALPVGAKLRLIAVLAKARAHDRKIHIVGEAGTNHLARGRATEVGAALVGLGATVEILEYDHNAISGVDRVRLVLRPADAGALSGEAATRGAGG